MNRTLVLTSGFLLIVSTSIHFAYKWYRKKYLPPRKWKKVAVLSDIYFFPMKSMKSISLPTVYCDKKGLKANKNSVIGDRTFMVVETKNGRFVSARQCNRLILIEPKIVNENQIMLYAPDMEPLSINISDVTEDFCISKLWGRVVFGRDCGQNASNWISRFICNENDGYSIIYYDENYADNKSLLRYRRYNKLYPFVEFFQGSFHDTTSFKLITAESIQNLNEHLENVTVSALNFRPNFVLSGVDKPYAEDYWDWIRIGDDVIFRYYKPCPRCQITTLNPESAEKNPNNEPLRTLVMYRQAKDLKIREEYSSNPVLGVNVGNYKTGFVKVGDPVYIGVD